MAEILPQIKISNGPSKIVAPVKQQTANMVEGHGGAKPKSDASVEGEIAISAVGKWNTEDWTQEEASQMAANIQAKILQIPFQVKQVQMDA